MGAKTSIEWTRSDDGTAGSSWNPIRARRDGKVGWHCEILTPGCTNCYAQTMNKFRGTRLPYLKTSRPETEVFLDEKTLEQPLHWKRPRRIFPCSMSDLFGEWVSDEMIDRIFAVMALCPQHTFQVLTKRHERMRDYVTDMSQTRRDGRGTAVSTLDPACQPLECFRWPLPNVWLGVSIEDQRRADERIPVLLQTPAAVRWISYEPALGPVDLDSTLGGTLWIGGQRGHQGRHHGIGSPDCPRELHHHHDERCERGLDWVVVGGESGPGARPFNIEWAHSIIAQCRAAGVPVFMKQFGAWPVQVIDGVMDRAHAAVDGPPRYIRASKGGDPTEWPEDLRVREYPA